MGVKVVEGEASHTLNTSEGEGMDGGSTLFSNSVHGLISGVMCMLYACEGVYRVTPPHPPVRPVSLVYPASLTHPASLAHPVSLAHCQLPLLHL